MAVAGPATPRPIHFGPATRRLFGFHRPPDGRPRQTSVLLLGALGMEASRSRRGLRQFGEALAKAGFASLRFDWSGTGDSDGDGRAARLAHWLDDARHAAAELQALSGNPELAIVGLRFGALLAQALVGDGHLAARSVLLWDAPPSGANYIDHLQHLERATDELRALQRGRSRALPPPARDELLGHDWPPELCREIAELPGLREDLPGRIIVVSRDRTPPESVESIRLPDVAHWSDVDRLDAPWLPTASFRIVAERLAHGLPQFRP